MIARIVQLLVFTFAVTGCTAKDKSDDLRKLLAEVPVNGAYTIGGFKAEAIGWNDSFQSGFVTFENQNAVKVLLAESKKVGIKEYIPIKGSHLIPKIEAKETPQIWLYKSKGKRDRRLYFVVEDKKIFFDLLLL